MVGKLGCGCCEPNTTPVPPGCVPCASTEPADVTPYTDDFSSVNPNWILVNPIAPNAITDYIRSGHAHIFKAPFVVYSNFSTQNIARCIPPEPVPSTGFGRQPWIDIHRFANLYFSATYPRKYRFEIVVNHPQDTIQNGLWPFTYGPKNGTWITFQVGQLNFRLYADGLTTNGANNDIHPNAYVQVLIQENALVPGGWESSTTVPFGQVKLRIDYYHNAITGDSLREYYVNDALIYSAVNGVRIKVGAFGTGECVSVCGVKISLIGQEPWSEGIWKWSGQFNGWFRGGPFYNAANPPPDFQAISWTAANNPADKLWFDDYSFDFVAP